MPITVNRAEPVRPPFGAWLLTQTTRPGPIGQLARHAAADRGFPRSGTPRQVSERLNALGADGDIHDALDDAELDWAAW